MKQYVLKKDSWHFKIANFDQGNARYCEDICEYIKAFFVGLSKIILLSSLATLLAGGFLYGFGNIIGWWLFGYTLHPSSVVPPIVLLFLLIFVATMKLKEYLINRPVSSEVDKEPGFVRLAYHKFKDKTCARIVLE